VLGPTGRNFAAGMSGGVAYVLDLAGEFPRHCNLQMIGLEALDEAEEIAEVRDMIQRHVEYTGSEHARNILDHWDEMVPKFVKVMPLDYRRVLEATRRVTAAGLSGDEAVMAAFEENVRSLARVGGS
jgi:glutamate synthase (ferredoxin)